MKNILKVVILLILCSFISLYFGVCLAEETGLCIVYENSIIEVTVDVNDLGTTVVFVVEAQNSDNSLYPISFNWDSDRGIVENQDNKSTFTITDVQLEDKGSYYCYVSDGEISTGVGCYLNIDAHLEWVKECPVDTYLEIGESITISVEAESDLPDISYEWYKWENEGIICAGGTIEIEINSLEDYGHYQVQATDGLNYTSSVVLVSPKTDLSLKVDNMVVVVGENIVITGTASITVAEESDKQIEEEYADELMVMWAKYTYYEDDDEYGIDDWFLMNGETEELYCTDYSVVLDGHSDASVKYRLEEGVLYADFSISITDLSDIWDGRYVIRAVNRFEGSASQLFSISVKDYIDITLVGDSGIGLSGVVHPDAKLFIDPIEDEETEKFFELAIEDNEYILISKEIYLVITGDAKEYKGELELSFPVGEEFEGKIMKVLHKTGDNLEVIYGTVTDGIMTFKVNSLSPFAITAEKRVDDPTSSDGQNDSENLNEDDVLEENEDEVSLGDNEDDQNKVTDNNEKSYTETEVEKGDKAVPKTGDDGSFLKYVFLFLVCSLVLLILIFCYSYNKDCSE